MMRREMTGYILLFLCSVFISALSQVMLKKSANKNYEKAIYEYLNPYVIIAYGLFFLASLLTVFAYKRVPLSMGPILEATGYIWVSLFSFFLLHEKIGKRKCIGMALIIAGILLFNINW